MTNVNTGKKNFTVVMRAPSAAIFLQDESLVLERVPSKNGPLEITFQSRWFKKRETVILPGDLWIEIQGTGNNFEDSLVAFANAAIGLLPLLALSANAAIGDADVEIAFETTPNISERDYFQNYLPQESDVLYSMRRIDGDKTIALLNAITKNPEAERLHRAANQYHLSLRYWKYDRQNLSLAHLWMALEALTKAKIRSECIRTGLKTPEQLAASLNVDIKELDVTIRRDFVLSKDAECYRSAKKASDGFEHGFLGYDEIRELSRNVVRRMAKHIRNSIFELAELDEDSKRILTTGRFEKPLGYWPVVKYFRGRLIGEKPELAAEGHRYPILSWNPVVTRCEITPDKQVNLSIQENKASLAEGIVIKPLSYEAWQPE
jgi:hypothetical protein